MTKNLEAADRISKLALSTMTVVFYLFDLIQGPFATILMILSVTMILGYLIKIFFVKRN